MGAQIATDHDLSEQKQIENLPAKRPFRDCSKGSQRLAK